MDITACIVRFARVNNAEQKATSRLNHPWLIATVSRHPWPHRYQDGSIGLCIGDPCFSCLQSSDQSQAIRNPRSAERYIFRKTRRHSRKGSRYICIYYQTMNNEQIYLANNARVNGRRLLGCKN